MSPGLDDEALSEVVGFVLILALVMAAISLYITYVLPAQGREDEIQKMGDVRDWFVNYKTQVDTLWMNSPPHVPSPSDTLSPSYHYPRSQDASSMDALSWLYTNQTELFDITSGGTTLSQVIDPATGSGTTPARMFIPILAPIRSSARVGLPEYHETLTITTNSTSDYANVSLRGLEFQSQNNYWIQQTYTYQDGGVFLVQNATSGNADISVLAYPAISIVNATTSPEVNLMLVNMIGTEEGVIGTSSPVMVRTWLNDPPDYVIANKNFTNVTLTAHTRSRPYAQMWADIFNNTVRNGLINSTATADSYPKVTYGDNNASITIDAPQNTSVNLTVSQANYTAHLQNVQSLME
ncbi:hypothetical protein [Methanosphaerula subterraneus]|uniref:hypothetical protein n=1 Tax=Methanosphaerula subterraneus TaxID=3350244 RepID=UPI003F84C312